MPTLISKETYGVLSANLGQRRAWSPGRGGQRCKCLQAVGKQALSGSPCSPQPGHKGNASAENDTPGMFLQGQCCIVLKSGKRVNKSHLHQG